MTHLESKAYNLIKLSFEETKDLALTEKKVRLILADKGYRHTEANQAVRKMINKFRTDKNLKIKYVVTDNEGNAFTYFTPGN